MRQVKKLYLLTLINESRLETFNKEVFLKDQENDKNKF
jgi:hypothetical protein